jgi:hypothetical protein
MQRSSVVPTTPDSANRLISLSPCALPKGRPPPSEAASDYIHDIKYDLSPENTIRILQGKVPAFSSMNPNINSLFPFLNALRIFRIFLLHPEMSPLEPELDPDPEPDPDQGPYPTFIIVTVFDL